MTIESRINDFMSLHKGDLSRFATRAEAALIALGHDVEALFRDEPAPVVPQPMFGSYPIVSDDDPDIKATANAFDPEPLDVVDMTMTKSAFDAEIAAHDAETAGVAAEVNGTPQ